MTLPPDFSWEGVYGSTTYSGQIVTVESAIRNAAVFACVRVLTSTIASLPVDVVRHVGKRRRPVTPTPSIVARPAASVRRRPFVAQTMRALATAGNAYWWIAGPDDRIDHPEQMETVDPRTVTWSTDPDTNLLTPAVAAKPAKLWPLGRLVHIPASIYLRSGSPVADSPVELAAQSIGTGNAAEEFGARYFGDSAHPSVLLSSKTELTQAQAEGIKARVKAAWVGREPAVIGSGIEAEFPTIDTTSTQFLDLIRFEVEQACRFWGVPPAMVYAAVSGQNVTYANVTDADNQYLKHSAGIWLSDIEDAWSELLARPDETVKFNVDAFLRMDAKGRHQLYRDRLRARTTTVNEVRALEDEDPFPDPAYDKPGIPGGYSSGPDRNDDDEENDEP